jgi:hypothetical protein
VSLGHAGNWTKETQKLAEDVSRNANRKMMAGADGATESDEHRPDEFFSYAFRHLIPLPILVKLFWSPHQPLPYPLMGVANPISSPSWAKVLMSGIPERITFNVACLWSIRAW